jgi:hypothetical protein
LLLNPNPSEDLPVATQAVQSNTSGADGATQEVRTQHTGACMLLWAAYPLCSVHCVLQGGKPNAIP